MKEMRGVGVLARCFFVLSLACLSGTALAEVRMATTVARVETTIDPGGRVKRELLPAERVLPGEELRYAITFTNHSETLVERGRIIITNAIPEGARYLSGSAGGESVRTEYSMDGETFLPLDPGAGVPEQGDGVASLRWTYDADLAPGESGEVFFHVRMQ
jgi:uncharacterized repeat protein (TIGR01451 family)